MTQRCSGRHVRLAYDPAHAGAGHRGRYGRTLAYVWVLGREGERAFMVNERLVREGYARVYTGSPFGRAGAFRRLEEVEKPTPRGDEVLIRVHATTVTSEDGTFRKGRPLAPGWPPAF